MTGVLALAHYTIAPGNVDAVRELLVRLEAATGSEPGCLSFESFLRLGDDRHVLLVEHFASPEALDLHRATPHFADLVLGQIVPLLEERRVETYSL